jgi:hypothetical protein
MFYKTLSAGLCLGLAFAVHTASASAQCTTCVVPTVTYSPVTYQAYRPVACRTYRIPTGGCCLSRFCNWLWGRPSETVVTSCPAPAPCVAAYPPCTTCASPCTTCASCTTCGCDPCSCQTVQQTSLRPVIRQTPCSSCGSNPCSCGARSSSPAIYAQRPAAGHANYTAATVYSPGSSASVPQSMNNQVPSVPTSYSNSAERKSLEPESRMKSYLYQPPRDARGTTGTSRERLPAEFTSPQREVSTDRTARRLSFPVQTVVYQAAVPRQAFAIQNNITVARGLAEQDAKTWNPASR